MNRMHALIFATCVLGAFGAALAQSDPAAAHQEKGVQKNQTATSRGERVFQQNCSRCHNAPQSFPPQISGTILRHMRVRASLSAADEKELLHFLNP
jgi:cytochrome c5